MSEARSLHQPMQKTHGCYAIFAIATGDGSCYRGLGASRHYFQGSPSHASAIFVSSNLRLGSQLQSFDVNRRRERDTMTNISSPRFVRFYSLGSTWNGREFEQRERPLLEVQSKGGVIAFPAEARSKRAAARKLTLFAKQRGFAAWQMFSDHRALSPVVRV